MRLAVISDIHGNYKALEAFLEYIEQMRAKGEGIDQILCLGDYFTDGPDPKKVMQMLREMSQNYPTYFVLGNREEYLLENFRNPQGWKMSSPNGMLHFVSQRLDQEMIGFMENLPMIQTLSYEGLPDITICHSAPTDTKCNFMEDPGKHAQCMKNLETSFLIAGHTHRQEVARLYNKTYVNPGALGLAIDGQGKKAPFAILTEANGNWEIKLESIPYDIDGYLKDFAESGMEEMGCVLARATKKTLLTGVNYFFKSVIEATQRTGMPIPKIPEEVWEEVARDLRIE